MRCYVLATHPLMLKLKLKMKTRYIGSSLEDILHEGLLTETITR